MQHTKVKKKVMFCVKIGKRANKTSTLLALAYGEYDVKKSRVHKWKIRLKEGRDDVF
jgi:hypothetical protein